MINDNLTQDYEPGYNLIEYEEGISLTIRFNCRHGLDLLSKVVYDHDNVMMTSSRSWVAIHKIFPPLGEGTDGNDWMERGWMRVHFSSEHLIGVTLLNLVDAIFKNRRQKINVSQNFLGCRKPG
jgi:hypothetical protein